ncbi:hypothetical protein HETIRDRAFT_427287 [Heterobasidion irregulare TC 32-1]|uniref:Uncharacterized protein n=1 Tax=Heterobasidion irregulare (strain TC 32-1) TaxID=747525 RepID=W4K8T7_HETIT|nr:uncharacterized protein HETIRDRAFT_427287 [Heterobasidion irregulare TC 32-1]ETW82164.1 hypothetical protein HETIRDRAFT_427287 [Heterobasidion irregulare TC 32-1]
MSDPAPNKTQDPLIASTVSNDQLQNLASGVSTLTKGIADLRTPLQTPLQAPPKRTVAPALALAPAPVAPTAPDVISLNVPSFATLASINPTVTVSPSLLSQFHLVELAVIKAIVNHNFRAADLYKLDPQHRGRGGWRAHDRDAMELGSLSSVIIPLGTYFSILGFAIAPANPSIGPIVSGFWAYIASLMQFASQYEWAAIHLYHVDFFTTRRREMQFGDYSQWGRIDVDILSRRLLGHNKVARPDALTPGILCMVFSLERSSSS